MAVFKASQKCGKFISLNSWCILHATGQSKACCVDLTGNSLMWTTLALLTMLSSAVLFPLRSVCPAACGQAAISFKLRTPLWPHSLAPASLTVQHFLEHIYLALCYRESKCQYLILFFHCRLWEYFVFLKVSQRLALGTGPRITSHSPQVSPQSLGSAEVHLPFRNKNDPMCVDKLTVHKKADISTMK